MHPNLPIPSDPEDLSTVWNDAGRAYYSDYSARLARYYGERDTDVDLRLEDPRSRAMGDAVLRHIIALNARGHWRRARELFDPAYSPLFGWIEPSNCSFRSVAILGPDELLVRRGSAWEDDGMTFHLRDGTATPVDDVIGVYRSRNRDHLVLARAAGLEIRDARAGIRGLDRPAIASIPWPAMDILRPRGHERPAWGAELDRFLVKQLGISDDGMRIVVDCYRQGILLASRHPGEPTWTLLWPDARPRYTPRLDPGEVPRAGDMTHVAISRDGTRLAYGSQDAGHFLAEIDGDGDGTGAGAPAWYATVGHLRSYPHHAWFSDDGRYTALNSCHFYEGATIAFDWDGNRGADLATYAEHPQAPAIDRDLRVYAACWLDEPVLETVIHRAPKSDGAFVLAGSGIMRLVDAKGELGFVQGFGSSAGSIDFCPESRRLALASSSGFIHVYDPYEDELPGRIDGWRARREVARWIAWKHLLRGLPIRW